MTRQRKTPANPRRVVVAPVEAPNPKPVKKTSKSARKSTKGKGSGE